MAELTVEERPEGVKPQSIPEGMNKKALPETVVLTKYGTKLSKAEQITESLQKERISPGIKIGMNNVSSGLSFT